MVSLKHMDEMTLSKQVTDVNLVFTSPPYNIGSKSPKKTGRRRLGGYDAKSWGAIEGYADNLPEAEYQEWQRDFLKRYCSVLAPGGVIAYQHKERHVKGELIQPEAWFPECLTLFDKVVWNRGSTHNHCQNYAYQQHEYVYLLKRRGERHHYNRGRLDSVVRIPPVAGSAHNAPMPEALVANIISKFCPKGGLVCDPFSGSGTTAVAARRLGRKFIGCEKLEKYYAMAQERLEVC